MVPDSEGLGQASSHPVAEDLLYWFRVIKHHEAKVGQLSSTVDPQLQDGTVLCRPGRRQAFRDALSLKKRCFSNQPTRLTFKELLEFVFVHIMRDVPHEELVGVGVADHPPTLGLALLTFSS